MENTEITEPISSDIEPVFAYDKKTDPSHTAKVVVVSVLSTLVLVALIFTAVWTNRVWVFKHFAASYASSVSGTGASLQSALSDQSLVESAVQKANPAVVAITVSEEVPTYSTTYEQETDPFAQFFGGQSPFGNMFQVPIQQQNGTSKQEVGAGSGFIITSDGMIVTNRHVVESTKAEYTVVLQNGKKYTATVLARDPVLDIALIKIDEKNLPYLTLGNSDDLKLGQSVIAIGNALGQFQNTISLGIVSGLSRTLVAGDEIGSSSEQLSQVIQTDTAINPGNSGGPLLDLFGDVIGVNVAIVQGSQNIGFALPINSIKTVIDSVQKTGKIIRPYLGVRYEMINQDIKDKYKLSVDTGALVTKGTGVNEPAVIPGSPGDKAGLKDGDIILSADGVTLDDNHDLALLVREKHVGDTLTLVVLSGGTQKTIKIVLIAAPEGK